MARILILGSAGQLGVELVKALSPQADVVALPRSEVDLSDSTALRAAIQHASPQIIVNAAAYTAVDKAESEPDLARKINSAAPQIMAEESLRLNAWLIHFSTDYVFDGSAESPWKETDATNPLNVYGRTKLEGEQGIAVTGCRHLIFRTSWVFAAHGNNFLRTMLRLGKERSRLTIVDDQFGAPTSAGELARATREVIGKVSGNDIQSEDSGVYHMTCSGSTNWFGFAAAIFANGEGLTAAPELVPIPSSEFPTPAKRPRNSVLNCDKLEGVLGVRLASWQDAMTRVITELRSAAQSQPAS